MLTSKREIHNTLHVSNLGAHETENSCFLLVTNNDLYLRTHNIVY